MNLIEGLFEPSLAIFGKIFGFFAILLTAFLFLVFGWLLALLVRKGLYNLFRKINLDGHLKEGWIGKFLSQGRISKSPAVLLGGFFYWLIIIMFVVIASQSLGLENTWELLEQFLIFIPRTIAFGLILIFGILFGSFIGKSFQIISGNLGIKECRTIGRIIQVVVLIYAGAVALKQLGVEVLAVTPGLNVFWAAVCFSLALSLGLGGKELVRNFLEDFVKKFSVSQRRKGTRQSTKIFTQARVKTNLITKAEHKNKTLKQEQKELFGDD